MGKKKKHKLKDGGRYSSARLGYDCGRWLALNPLNALKKARHMVWENYLLSELDG
jgi:hypothetical protein